MNKDVIISISNSIELKSNEIESRKRELNYILRANIFINFNEIFEEKEDFDQGINKCLEILYFYATSRSKLDRESLEVISTAIEDIRLEGGLSPGLKKEANEILENLGINKRIK